MSTTTKQLPSVSVSPCVPPRGRSSASGVTGSSHGSALSLPVAPLLQLAAESPSLLFLVLEQQLHASITASGMQVSPYLLRCLRRHLIRSLLAGLRHFKPPLLPLALLPQLFSRKGVQLPQASVAGWKEDEKALLRQQEEWTLQGAPVAVVHLSFQSWKPFTLLPVDSAVAALLGLIPATPTDAAAAAALAAYCCVAASNSLRDRKNLLQQTAKSVEAHSFRAEGISWRQQCFHGIAAAAGRRSTAGAAAQSSNERRERRLRQRAFADCAEEEKDDNAAFKKGAAAAGSGHSPALISVRERGDMNLHLESRMRSWPLARLLCPREVALQALAYWSCLAQLQAAEPQQSKDFYPFFPYKQVSSTACDKRREALGKNQDRRGWSFALFSRIAPCDRTTSGIRLLQQLRQSFASVMKTVLQRQQEAVQQLRERQSAEMEEASARREAFTSRGAAAERLPPLPSSAPPAGTAAGLPTPPLCVPTASSVPTATAEVRGVTSCRAPAAVIDRTAGFLNPAAAPLDPAPDAVHPAATALHPAAIALHLAATGLHPAAGAALPPAASPAGPVAAGGTTAAAAMRAGRSVTPDVLLRSAAAAAAADSGGAGANGNGGIFQRGWQAGVQQGWVTLPPASGAVAAMAASSQPPLALPARSPQLSGGISVQTATISGGRASRGELESAATAEERQPRWATVPAASTSRRRPSGSRIAAYCSEGKAVGREEVEALVLQHVSEIHLLELHWLGKSLLLRRQQLRDLKNVAADLLLLQRAAREGRLASPLVLPPLPSAFEGELGDSVAAAESVAPCLSHLQTPASTSPGNALGIPQFAAARGSGQQSEKNGRFALDGLWGSPHLFHREGTASGGGKNVIMSREEAAAGGKSSTVSREGETTCVSEESSLTLGADAPVPYRGVEDTCAKSESDTEAEEVQRLVQMYLPNATRQSRSDYKRSSADAEHVWPQQRKEIQRHMLQNKDVCVGISSRLPAGSSAAHAGGGVQEGNSGSASLPATKFQAFLSKAQSLSVQLPDPHPPAALQLVRPTWLFRGLLHHRQRRSFSERDDTGERYLSVEEEEKEETKEATAQMERLKPTQGCARGNDAEGLRGRNAESGLPAMPWKTVSAFFRRSGTRAAGSSLPRRGIEVEPMFSAEDFGILAQCDLWEETVKLWPEEHALQQLQQHAFLPLLLGQQRRRSVVIRVCAGNVTDVVVASSSENHLKVNLRRSPRQKDSFSRFSVSRCPLEATAHRPAAAAAAAASAGLAGAAQKQLSAGSFVGMRSHPEKGGYNYCTAEEVCQTEQFSDRLLSSVVMSRQSHCCCPVCEVFPDPPFFPIARSGATSRSFPSSADAVGARGDERAQCNAAGFLQSTIAEQSKVAGYKTPASRRMGLQRQLPPETPHHLSSGGDSCYTSSFCPFALFGPSAADPENNTLGMVLPVDASLQLEAPTHLRWKTHVAENTDFVFPSLPEQRNMLYRALRQQECSEHLLHYTKQRKMPERRGRMAITPGERTKESTKIWSRGSLETSSCSLSPACPSATSCRSSSLTCAPNLQLGSVFISRHSNSGRVNAVFHLVVRDDKRQEKNRSATASEDQLPSRKVEGGDKEEIVPMNVLQGVGEILRLCSTEGVRTLVLPLLLLEGEAAVCSLTFAVLQRRALQVVRYIINEVKRVHQNSGDTPDLRQIVLVLPPLPATSSRTDSATHLKSSVSREFNGTGREPASAAVLRKTPHNGGNFSGCIGPKNTSISGPLSEQYNAQSLQPHPTATLRKAFLSESRWMEIVMKLVIEYIRNCGHCWAGRQTTSCISPA